MIGDLHVHTTHSGGALSPREAVLRAKERGLGCIAVADRNTTAGVWDAVKIGLRIGLTVLPGVELVCRDGQSGGAVAVLGYCYRSPAPRIEALCNRQGAANDRGAPPLDPAEALSAIKADGGRAVLFAAEPDDLEQMLPRLIAEGLDGIEEPPRENRGHDRVVALAVSHGLLLTAGSAAGAGRDGHDDATGEVGARCARQGVCEALAAPADAEARLAVDLARLAGGMIRDAASRDVEVELKGGDIRDLVTAHDVEVERFLMRSISERYPSHRFITEEHDNPASGREDPLWIIDPIDGTTNFVTSRSYFAVSVARYQGNTPVFGVVYDVMADELYLGVAGEGAWLNGMPLTTARAGAAKPLEECVVEASLFSAMRLHDRFGTPPEFLGSRVRAQRAYGCASLGICRVATGALDVYLSSTLSVWDYAAASIVLSETGGTVAVERSGDEERLPALAGTRLVIAAGCSGYLYALQRGLFPEGSPARPDLRPL